MVAAFILRLVISLAISYGTARIQQKKAEAEAKKREKENAGRKLSVTYGERDPRRVSIGVVCGAGQEVYRNTYGAANKYLEIVYRLSDWYETSLLRVASDGAWVTLGAADGNGWREVTSGEYDGAAWVKYVDGSQTTADSQLVTNSNPSGRWENTAKGDGIAYAIVRVEQNTKRPLNEPRFRFERQGAPLYDWRKDTTVGGSGSHRWNDVSTWEFSENPILALYAYMRGGFEWDGDTFCGMDVEADWLPLEKWTAAADICDQIVNYTLDGGAASENRYRASVDLVAAGQDHGSNIDVLLESCAGFLVNGANTVYPVINAAQTAVATLTDADLIDGEAIEFDRDGSFGDRVNAVRGTYVDPASLYENVGYEPIVNSAAQILDGRSRDFEMSFLQVPSKRQAEQLASIYLLESRYPATKRVTVDPKWQVLEPGDWITWTGDIDGEDRDYQVSGIDVMADDALVPRMVILSLIERNSAIYGAVDNITSYTFPAQPGEPTFIDEADNFALLGVQVEQSSGTGLRPAIRATWNLEDDDTVEDIEIEYWPTDQSDTKFNVITKYENARMFLQAGIVAETEYTVRHRLISPLRATVWSATQTVTTPAASSDFKITLPDFQAEITELFSKLSERMRRLEDIVPEGISASSSQLAGGYVQRRSLQKTNGNTLARLIAEETVRADGDSALSSSITGLEAEVDTNLARLITEETTRASADSALSSSITAVEATANNATAQGLVKLEATSAPSGVAARFGVYLRTSAGDSYDSEAAQFLEVLSGGGTRSITKADQVAFIDASNNAFALFENGQTYLKSARIPNLSANKITTGTLNASLVTVSNLSATSITSGTLNVGSITISGGSLAVVSFVPATATINPYDADYDYVRVSATGNVKDSNGGPSSTGQPFIQLVVNAGNPELNVRQLAYGPTTQSNYNFHLQSGWVPMADLSNASRYFRLRQVLNDSPDSNLTVDWVIEKIKETA